MFGDGTTRPNSGMIVAKIRFDGQLPAIQPVLRTGDGRHITVERPAPRDTLHAHTRLAKMETEAKKTSVTRQAIT